MHIWKTLYIRPLFFYAFGALVFLLALSHAFPLLFFPARLALLAFAITCIIEVTLLYAFSTVVISKRKMALVFSLGDVNNVELSIQNMGNQTLHITVIEELPYQLQIRDFRKSITLPAYETKKLNFSIEPKERGLYTFHSTLIFIASHLGLFDRKVITGAEQKVSVYPSIAQIKKNQIQSQATTVLTGMKKTRRLGHNYEFDHIKSYVIGDDYRSINWKMTGKRNALMVNQYEEEKAQQIYCIIDDGRTMGMPFNGLSLLDYAVNSALALASTAIQKQDRAGLVTFSKKINAFLKADSSNGQLQKIYQHLYNERQNDNEPSFEYLYTFIRHSINTRSQLFLFTSFDSTYSLQRVLPLLRMLNKIHLLVIIFFENDELKKFSQQTAESIENIYTSAIAEKMINEKKQMATILRQHGIQAILTSPQKLTIDTLNKYLEIKARGLS